MTTEQRAVAIEKQAKVVAAKLRVIPKRTHELEEAEAAVEAAIAMRDGIRTAEGVVVQDYESAASKLQELLMAEVLA